MYLSGARVSVRNQARKRHQGKTKVLKSLHWLQHSVWQMGVIVKSPAKSCISREVKTTGEKQEERKDLRVAGT